MNRSQIALLTLGLGVAGIAVSLRAQQGERQQPKVIVYKSPT